MQSAIVWMGGITPEMDSAYIIEAFANMGYTAIAVKEIINKHTGVRASYCFVDFGDVNIAREVLIKVNNQAIPGSKNGKFILNRSEYGRTTGGTGEYSLFVGDLSPEVNDDMLLDFFRTKYQSVRVAKVVLDERGYPKGYGFVRFDNEADHNKALVEMQGATGLGEKALRLNRALKSRKHEPPAHASSSSSSSLKNIPTPPTNPMDPSMIPGFIQLQMQYMQQMHAYMEQCHQYAQQAAVCAGWAPPPADGSQTVATTPASTEGSVLSYIQQQHEQLVSETVALPENEELIDPNPAIDVATLNQEIIDLDDKLFFELEVSRWCPELAVFGVRDQRPLKIRRE